MVYCKAVKLVRSRIPEIIRRSGHTVEMHRATTRQEVNGFLRSKLLEEVHELLRADSKEDVTDEMADVLEVLDALQRCLGICAEDVARAKATKLTERGPFEDVILHRPYRGSPGATLCAECTQLASSGQKLCSACNAHEPT